MKPPPPELRALIDRLLDGGGLTRPQMARLEEMLEDDEHLACYLDLTQQEAALPELLAKAPAVAPPRGSRRRLLPALALAAAAACAAFFIGLGAGRHQGAPANVAASPPSTGPAARITGLMGVRWTSADHPDLLARSGSLGQLAIESGLVEITYASGVRLTLEGPARFDVTDHESGRLSRGKLVASVPKGAEGFRIDYADGSVIDLGTEFAMDVGLDGTADIGVFDGEIELHTGGGLPMALFESHAVRHDRHDLQEPVRAIPFQREKFVRRLPSRDFAWEITRPGVEELVFDVSHLVWKASEYRAIFKWIHGMDAVIIDHVELRLDGRPVAADSHQGITGTLGIVRDNVFSLDLPEDRFASGRWTLHATVRPHPRQNDLKHYTGPVASAGILQFEEGLVSNATAADFLGRWSYHHLGYRFIREFHPDGTISLFINGELQTGEFVGLRFTSNDSARPEHLVRLSAVVDAPGIDYNQWAAGFGLDPAGDGAPRADPDGDGLPNEEERTLESSPIDPADPDARPWLPRPEKAVMMVFSAHPDDEGIFFGGALPYYTRVRKIPVVLVGVTSGDYVLAPQVREQELRNAARAYGLRTHPVFPRFKDAPFSSLDQNFDVWGGGAGSEAGRAATALEFARWIRRYRPDVVLTHDFDGEYGHNNHKATALATVDAVNLAADPGVTIGDLMPWQVKKLYVNQYPGAPVFHDHWEETSIDLDGDGIPDSTPRQVANLGLAEHQTQNNGNFKASTVYLTGENSTSWDDYPAEHWGLHSSTVGPDTVVPDFTVMGTLYQGWARGDFLENITAFPDRDGDGLPDAWELHHFGGITAADPRADSDADGVVDSDEFLFGLDPRRPDRVGQSARADGFHFHLPAAAGPGYEGLARRYQLLHSSDLTEWRVLAEGVAEGIPILVPWPAGNRGFARLKVRLEGITPFD